MKEELKASDLRIGNIIEKYGKPITVDLGILQKIQNGSIVYKPIKLTEELLIKLGFDRENTSCLSLRLYDNSYLFAYQLDHKYFVSVCVEGIDIDDRSDEFDVKLDIVHLHKLQNFYFSFTSEELTLTETPCPEKE
ncbi:hypothetical protein U9K52_09840 [Chryseobacterium sp. MHB01]|uniref:hypothetical protein n=1 Tax=Chryseobacterium sp. MHB01 TaxID=3109433 RepID=UPI002AFF3179|nr:hypothetical protein [Chryseobacterium sp. MHB01]MEA1849213.1 hypothetical protein [Chryseobacterium sp. MHB01]